VSARSSAGTTFVAFNVNVRIKISALWTSMLFVFIYVDHYSLFRPDIRADIEAGKISGFTINQSYLLVVTAYIAIPALMVFLSLILRPGVDRIANIALGVIYALTIVVNAFAFCYSGLIAPIGSGEFKAREIVFLAIGLTIFCAAVFVGGLKLPIPMCPGFEYFEQFALCRF